MRLGRGVRRRGAALILVVVVIAALLAIAAPFVVSMRLHEKSSRAFTAQVKAKHTADGARNLAVGHLRRSHADEERRAREAGGTRVGDQEGVDGHDEVQAFAPQALAGLGSFDVANPKGAMAQVTVRDERGRIDLNTAGPDALANLLGSTLTRATISYREEDELPLVDIFPFLHTSDGDPETIDGFVRVRGEYIAYRDVDARNRSLKGLIRGFLFSRGEEPEDGSASRNFHPEGSLVQDGRGHKLAYDPLWRYMGSDRQGLLARFDNTAGVRRISDWEFASLRAALVLFRQGVNMRLLRQWGVANNDLLGAGLHPADFDVEQAIAEGESAAERREREKIERTLERWSVPVEFAKRFGGSRALKRIYERLMAMDEDRRDKQIQRYKQREDQLQDRLRQVSGWLKDETKRQLAGLSEMRNHAPHLETVGRIELEERVRPYVTTHATPEGEAWSDPQTVNYDVEFRPYAFTTELRVHDTRRFKAGWIVKIQPRLMNAGDAPRLPEYRMCTSVRGFRVNVFPQLDFDYEANEVEVSCRQPRPINVNTASREVLTAVMTGLQSRAGQRQRATGGQAPNFVTPEQARAVAAALVANQTPLTTFDELRNLLLQVRQAGGIDDHDLDAIFRNAIDPADPLLTRGTIPFCFRSGDVYSLDVTGIQNDEAGNELARYSFREVVRVAPPRPLVWHIDSQADFTDRLYVLGNRTYRQRERNLGYPGTMPWLPLPGRFSSLTQTWPVHLGPWDAGPLRYPSRSHAPGEGELRPLMAREPDLPAGSTDEPSWGNLGTSGPQPGGLAPHSPSRWDDRVDGEDLSTIALQGGEVPTRWLRTENQTGWETLGSGLIRGWFRLDTITPQGTKSFLFDGGQADTRERISLYLDGPTRMVLEVFDGSLDQLETGGQKRSVQLVYDRPPNRPFQAGSWYHVAAFFRGAERGDLALAVDGVFVGQETHGTRLSAPMDRYGFSLEVEDASGFPPSGLVRVGGGRWVNSPSPNDRGIHGSGLDASHRCEVLRYSSIQGNTLILADRQPLPPSTSLFDATDLEQRSGGRSLTNLPRECRRPLRGSGHRVRFRALIINPRGQRRPGASSFQALGYPHDVGTQVVPYGYSSWLKNEPAAASATGMQGVSTSNYQENLRVGGATLRQPLPSNTPYTVAWREVPPVPGGGLPIVIQAGDTEIPAFWLEDYASETPTPITTNDPNVIPTLKGGWPPLGIIRMGSERIFYDGIDPVGGRFLNCVRGVEGTTATAHALFAPIVLESIVVSDTSDYPRRSTFTEPRVYVSLTTGIPGQGGTTEWLSVMDCANPAYTARGLWLIPPKDDLNQLPPFRFRSLLEQMWRNNQIRGLNPGLRTQVPPVPQPPNPVPPTYQPPLYAPYSGSLIKELLKREEPSVATNLRLGRQVTPLETGSRRAKGTSRPPNPMTGHSAGTRLCPTFVIRPDDGHHRGNPFSILPDSCEVGLGDVVTITDDSNAPEERRVAHSAFSVRVPANLQAIARQLGLPDGDQGLGWLVSFDDFVSRPFTGAANARLLKWPVGNLHRKPNLVFGRARDPSGPNDVVGDAPGTLPGRVDDFAVEQLVDRDRQTLLTDLPLSLEAHTASLGPVPGGFRSWQRGRIFRSDGEILAVTDASQTQGGSELSLARGVMNSTAAPISRETTLWRMTWPPHAIASGGFGGSRRNLIPVRQIDPSNRFRSAEQGGGYLRAEPNRQNQAVNVHSYIRYRGGRNAYFDRPIDRWGRGTFSGAFRAGEDAPQGNILLTDLPFRHHDRYRPRTSSVQGVFLQVSKEIPGGFVERVTWDAARPTNFAQVLVAVRVDGVPNWDAPPVPRGESRQRGRLYLFDDPRAPNRIDIPATRVEVRVYLTFGARAFDEDGWKDGAVLGGLRVHYRQATRSLRREERTD